MFLARCEKLGDALIWASDLIGMVNSDHGILVSYRCVCGDTAVMVTGSRSDVRVSVHLELAA